MTRRQYKALQEIRKEADRRGAGMAEIEREDGVIVVEIETPIWPTGIMHRTIHVATDGKRTTHVPA